MVISANKNRRKKANINYYIHEIEAKDIIKICKFTQEMKIYIYFLKEISLYYHDGEV